MIFIDLIFYGVSALMILEAMYVIVMGLQRAQEENKLAPWAITVGTGFMYVGLVWDVLCNVLVASVIFLEIPKEYTVSERLRRLVQNPPGIRRTMATWFAVNLLNPFSNNGPHVPIPEDT